MSLQDSLDQLQSFDFNELDFDNVGHWPVIVRVIALFLAFAIVLGAGYATHVSSKQAALEAERAKEVTLKREFEDKYAQAANLGALRKQKAEMELTFDGLKKQLPRDTEVPGLIEDITRTALDNNLTIESIDLRKETESLFYVELPIQIVVTGGYHRIGSFVSGVANLSRIVTLHDFKITRIDQGQELRMEILAKTYRYMEDE